MAIDRRRIQHGSSATVATLAFVGLLLVVNVLAQRHFKRWDWTGSKIFSLSDKTLKTLAALKEDVEAKVLVQPGEEMYDETRELLDNYQTKSAHLKVEFLDPAKEPARVEQVLKRLGIDARREPPAVVFVCGDRNKHVSATELVEYDMSEAGMGGPPRIKAFKGEIAFTSAILSVTQTRQKSVLVLKGHQEVSTDDFGASGLGQFAKALAQDNMKVDSTDVLGRSPLPEGTDLLIVPGPTLGFTTPEADALAKYIDGGGRVLALIDPPFSREKTLQKLGIERVFLDRGIAIGDDIVVDPSQRLLFGGAESFAASDFPYHEITKDLTGTFVVFRLARSVAPVQPAPKDWTISPLVRTTDAGWGETELAKLGEAGISKGPEDLQGPVCVAVAAVRKAEGGKDAKEARLVVVGDSDLAQNQLVGAQRNLDFLLNAVHWLTGSEEEIGIAPRAPEQVRLAMTGPQERGVMIMTLLAMPALAVAGGIVVWLFRRR